MFNRIESEFGFVSHASYTENSCLLTLAFLVGSKKPCFIIEGKIGNDLLSNTILTNQLLVDDRSVYDLARYDNFVKICSLNSAGKVQIETMINVCYLHNNYTLPIEISREQANAFLGEIVKDKQALNARPIRMSPKYDVELSYLWAKCKVDLLGPQPPLPTNLVDFLRSPNVYVGYDKDAPRMTASAW